MLDEYAYTSMVANCGQRQSLDQALALVQVRTCVNFRLDGFQAWVAVRAAPRAEPGANAGVQPSPGDTTCCAVRYACSKVLFTRFLQEMQERCIPCNVHTYSALMNVAIKCGQYRLALDVYRDMRAAVSAGQHSVGGGAVQLRCRVSPQQWQAVAGSLIDAELAAPSPVLLQGCHANVVTFNTLCDVYGKSGQWEEALAGEHSSQLACPRCCMCCFPFCRGSRHGS